MGDKSALLLEKKLRGLFLYSLYDTVPTGRSLNDLRVRLRGSWEHSYGIQKSSSKGTGQQREPSDRSISAICPFDERSCPLRDRTARSTSVFSGGRVDFLPYRHR